MYLRFPTLVELIIEAGAVPASPRDIPRLLGVSYSSWHAYRAGTRNPGSGEEAPLLRSNAASLLAKACSAAGKAAVDPERYVANLFSYQDFLVRLDSLLPGALPAAAAGLAAAVLSSARPSEPRPPAMKCLGALLAQDPGGAGDVLAWLLGRRAYVEIEEEAPSDGRKIRLPMPLDPEDPAGGFLSLMESGSGRKGAVFLPAPVWLDALMCCADRIALEISALHPSAAGRRVAAAASTAFRDVCASPSPGIPITIF